jgi:hypothetical protein
MYRGFAETWRGLSKNAREGMATRNALPVWTVVLGGGLVTPFLLLPVAWAILPWSNALLALTAAVAALMLGRLVMALRFGQKLMSVPLLPLGIALLLVLQWRALLAQPDAQSLMWRGRTRVTP